MDTCEALHAEIARLERLVEISTTCEQDDFELLKKLRAQNDSFIKRISVKNESMTADIRALRTLSQKQAERIALLEQQIEEQRVLNSEREKQIAEVEKLLALNAKWRKRNSVLREKNDRLRERITKLKETPGRLRIKPSDVEKTLKTKNAALVNENQVLASLVEEYQQRFAEILDKQ